MWVGGYVGSIDVVDYIVLVDVCVFVYVCCKCRYMVVQCGVGVLVVENDDVVIVVLFVGEVDYVVSSGFDFGVGWSVEVDVFVCMLGLQYWMEVCCGEV